MKKYSVMLDGDSLKLLNHYIRHVKSDDAGDKVLIRKTFASLVNAQEVK
jgi:hypothetical protein